MLIIARLTLLKMFKRAVCGKQEHYKVTMSALAGGHSETSIEWV